MKSRWPIQSLFLLLWISQCMCDNSIWEAHGCFRHLLKYSSLCVDDPDNRTLPIDLHGPNTTYFGQEFQLSASVNTNSNSSLNNSYNFLFCAFHPFPLPSWTKHVLVNYTNVTVNSKWNFVGVAKLYVFVTKDPEEDHAGCASQDVLVKNCSIGLKLNLTLEQDELNGCPFRVGNITVLVAVNASSTDISNETCPSIDEASSGSAVYSGAGSANGVDGGVESENTSELIYNYTLFYCQYYDTQCTQETGSVNGTIDGANITLSLHVPDVTTNCSVFIEVITAITTEQLRYGSAYETPIVVFEPVHNVKVTTDDANTGEHFSVFVQAQGSAPITVEWNLFYEDSGAVVYCHENSLILNEDNGHDKFWCSFNNSGTYNISTTFRNNVSTDATDNHFKISQPPPINVVATSTSAVIVLVVLLIVIVIAIVLVGSYISYRRFRNRATETANFSFVQLKEPSKLQRLRTYSGKMKDKFTKRKKRFGLVNTTEDETVDSFYGSLNPFAAHESL